MESLNNIRTQLCDETKWTRLEGGRLTSFDKPKLTLWDWILHHLGVSSVPSKATFAALNNHIVSSLSDAAATLEDVQTIKSRLLEMNHKTTTQKGAFDRAIGALQAWETKHTAKLTADQEKATRLQATNRFLTEVGKDWHWLKAVASPEDYSKFQSGELQLVKVEDGPETRAISPDVLRKHQASAAVRTENFLDDRGLPPAAKSVDPYAMSSEGLKQWKKLLESELSYSDLKNLDTRGMDSFLKMTGHLDVQGMGECETLRKALQGLSSEERARITGDKTLLRERVTAYENEVALKAIYQEICPGENDFERMTKDALNRMFKATVVDDIFSGKNPLGSEVEDKFRSHLQTQKRCADNIIQNEERLQELYRKFHSEFDGIAFREWSERVLNQYQAGLGDQALKGEVAIDPGTFDAVEKMLTPTEEDQAAILRAERLLKWIEMGNDPEDFPG